MMVAIIRYTSPRLVSEYSSSLVAYNLGNLPCRLALASSAKHWSLTTLREKLIKIGAKVVTLSDSSGLVIVEEGLTEEMWQELMDLKNVRRGRIRELADKFKGVTYTEGTGVWNVKCDIALPCATQNEINEADALHLLDNGVYLLSDQEIDQ